MRVVCVSDTHRRHEKLEMPGGDLLLHAGDITRHGEREDVEAFDAWLGSLPYRHKVVIAGNHDFLFQQEPRLAQSLITNAVYLEDSGATVEGLRVWGSPWQPWFFDWAFNLRRGQPLREKWELIPPGTDLLLTHGPPHGILDQVQKVTSKVIGAVTGQGDHVGCEELLLAVKRLKPRLHVFGHIHEAYGVVEQDGTTFVNASSCDLGYKPVNPPVVLDL
jgi:predicted phosphodiesterase